MKTIYKSLAIATALFATACSNEAVTISNDGNSVVTFAVSTPDFGSRAEIGDGTTATTLTYAVYDKEWNHIATLDGTTTINTTTDVDLSLIDGKTYNVIFWADNDAAPYTFNAAAKTMTINYSSINSNDENLDAFYGVVTNLRIYDGIPAQPVELTRPFAQLNIATSDYATLQASNEEITKTSVMVSAYSTLNLVTGEVSDAAVRTFALNAIPSETFTIDNNPTLHKWLSVNYLLVYDKELVDVILKCDNDEVSDKSYTNVPIERNYKTNITGKLLSSSVDFTITINKATVGDYDVDTDTGTIYKDGVAQPSI